ncbi:hypothetical protein ANCCEY_15397, partial [Ancylostoma ceylanicum]
MSMLMVNDSVDFLTLKEMLNASDGNIASHISALEKAGYRCQTDVYYVERIAAGRQPAGYK